MELRQDGGGDVFGEFFNEAPFAAFAEFEQELGDGKVVDGFVKVVGGGGWAEIEVEVEVDEKALGMSAFFVGDADAVGDFEVMDVNGVHGRRLTTEPRRHRD